MQLDGKRQHTDKPDKECVAKVHNGHELIEEEDYNKGKVMLMPKQMSKIKFEISKEYTTDLTRISLIGLCSDGSMWIGDQTISKLQHVILTENRTEVITSLNIKIFGMALTHSNNFLVVTDSTKIKLINTMKGQITDSKYDVKPLYPICIHVTSDHHVIIGAKPPGANFSATERRVVVVMDQEGKQLKEYRNHKKRLFDLPRILTSMKHDKHLFSYPRRITGASNGNICLVDWFSNDDRRGQVVVLSHGGDILGIYTGHPDVNTNNNPFTPVGILTTPSDNIVVTDLDNHLLHILTDQGQLITYCNLREMGILHPYSLALSYYKAQDELIGAFEDIQLGVDEDMDDSEEAKQLLKTAGLFAKITFFANLVLLAAKAVAAFLSGSISIISSLVDSVVDLSSGVIIWVTGRAIRQRLPYVYPQGQIKMLTGHTAKPDFLKKLTWICVNHHPKVQYVDTVRAFHFGNNFLVEVDIVLPEDMTLKEAHDIGEPLQQKLERLKEVERAFVHLDYEFEHNPLTEHKMA
ncbi:Metal tolerance protein 6,Metal tolerance protein 9,Metal tolerance protein 10,Metal tolerance protein 5 [Mytilus coruscus]|uniref:Metal tolerance protein 6,Metal tolerance protein 9,Metal tolerance protein 10,Metal tolerance protein 5 n=1 Tax=Mytilus coruscus TaxID=42192 RepID=A0A6J8D6B4_MYTCO|nr:Metal tolerance protein 6,Metal tolerance protein 9,Metal tolerance protein 10,Metal tolerance protein 5 [Mytilus coruscus]